MSRPYETSLADYLARLNRFIAESEAFVSRSSDDETICSVNKELARQRELRAQCENTLRWTKLLNRIALRTNFTFWISFAILFAISFGPFSGELVVLLVVCDFLLLVVSATSFVGAIIARDIVAQGHRPWRFSLRTVFMITTMIAIVLSLLILAFQG